MDREVIAHQDIRFCIDDSTHTPFLFTYSLEDGMIGSFELQVKEGYRNQRLGRRLLNCAEAIAKKLGMTLEIKDVEFGSIVAGVQTGKYDIGMAGMTVNDERKQQVNFSDSYAKGIQVVIVKEGSEYKSVDDFFVLDAEGNHTAVKEGVLVGVQQNTTGDIYCSDTLENFGFGEDKVKRYSNGADAVAALASGKLSAVVIDDQPAKEFVKANEGLTILEGSYADEDYAIAVGKENSELLEKINKALKELTDDGTIAKIVAKYIKAE